MFGWKEHPYFDINDDIRIVSGKMWANRKRDYIFISENAETQIKPGVFNVLYPHFGYELELYPRQETVNEGRSLIKEFDALIVHHTHCPQPVTAESVNGVNKLLAYSLGDFMGELTTRKYQYGIVVKVELGKNDQAKWLLGKVEWSKTRCSLLPVGIYVVNLSNDAI